MLYTVRVHCRKISLYIYCCVRACRHLATFDPGTTYIYKCDLLVSFMPYGVWLMKLTRMSHLYM